MIEASDEVKVHDVGLHEIEGEDDSSAQGEEETIELDEEEDCAPKRIGPDPGAPTLEEREEHEVHHGERLYFVEKNGRRCNHWSPLQRDARFSRKGAEKSASRY